MRWEDERYVRIYTRDTPEWTALSWDARAVFWGLLRRCDRAGILRVGKAGLRALAGVIPAPLDVVERAVPELLADGCLLAAEGAYIVPNFLKAQEAISTDAQRKRDQRERDRARMMAEGVQGTPSALDKAAALERSGVTVGDAASLVGVTPSHINNPPVTSSHSVPSRAVPDCAVPEKALSATADLPELLVLEPVSEKTPSAYKAAQTAIMAVFLAVCGQAYKWQAAKDSVALKRILATGATPDEIGFRFKRLLEAGPNEWPRGATVAQLDSCWNDLTARQTAPASRGATIDVKKGRVPAETQDGLHGPPGEHPF